MSVTVRPLGPADRDGWQALYAGYQAFYGFHDRPQGFYDSAFARLMAGDARDFHGLVAEAESEAITLDPVELEDALWLSRADLAAVMAGTHPVLLAPRRGAIAGWLMRGWLAG